MGVGEAAIPPRVAVSDLGRFWEENPGEFWVLTVLTWDNNI